MTDATLSLPRARPFLAEPVFATAGLLIGLSLVVTLSAAQLDDRLFQGEGVWVKPVKFQIALSVYFLTLAYFARFMPEGVTARRGWQIYARLVVFAAAAELAWIGGAAMHGTASHFNVVSPAMGAIYSAMGVFAVLLTSASLTMGVATWRNAATGLDPALKLSLALGLTLTFFLTLAVAMVMASGSGHHVGTPVLDARVPLMGWSREVGDLRVPHFLVTHALHFLPLSGLAAMLLPGRLRGPAVWCAAALFTALVLALFAQALAGIPVLPLA